MARKPELGDIYEIETPRGIAYFQNVYLNNNRLNLIRVLPGTYDAPPPFDELAKAQEVFYLYFALSIAKSRGIVKLVANEPIPAWVQSPPPMRKPGRMEPDGKIVNWLISYPEGTKITTELTDEEKRLSLDLIWNDTLLIDRICSGWRPEKSVKRLGDQG